MRINEVIKLSAKPGSDPAKEWITKVYSQFPASPLDARQHYMVFDDNSVALFELVPSFDVDGAVEIKWLQANPPGTGAGGKAIKALQDIAKKDGMTLTLYPWDKGDMTQDQLIKYYSRFGFKQADPDYPDMVWNPTQINEVFDSSTTGEIILDTPSKLKIRATIGNRDIIFAAKRMSNEIEAWYVLFTEVESEFKDTKFDALISGRKGKVPGTVEVTKSGNEFEVFSFIVHCMRLLIKTKNPEMIGFSAVGAGSNRPRLYARMLSRLLPPNYEVSTNVKQTGTTNFMIDRV